MMELWKSMGTLLLRALFVCYWLWVMMNHQN
jgi:cbb3-type cytochrome oxidase subunit 3